MIHASLHVMGLLTHWDRHMMNACNERATPVEVVLAITIKLANELGKGTISPKLVLSAWSGQRVSREGKRTV